MRYHYRTRGTHNNIIDINGVAIMASIITSLNANGGILVRYYRVIEETSQLFATIPTPDSGRISNMSRRNDMTSRKAREWYQ
jgi:hypothetical protein